MSVYLTKGFETTEYNVFDGTPHQDFMHLVGMTEHHTKALDGSDEEVEAFKPQTRNVLYGTVAGHYRTDELLERSVLFIDVDGAGGEYDAVQERVTGGILSGMNMVVYPSISNGIKTGARLRIGVELSREVTQEEYGKVWGVLTTVHELEADLNGVTQNWNQLAGTYTLTSQNSVHKPYIKSDGQALNVDAFIRVYDNEPDKFRIKPEKPAVTAPSLTNGLNSWQAKNDLLFHAMLDPEKYSDEYGGWDNMLTTIAGYVFRETGQLATVIDVVEMVNNKGTSPLEQKALDDKYISWAKNWTNGGNN